VAHAATIPPRRTAPTRRGRHRPRPPLAGPEGYGAARTHPAGTGHPGGQADRAQKHPPKRTLSDQPPGDLQKLDRAVSYEESWGLHTAADIHYGRARHVRAARADVLTTAYTAHPERFVRQPPAPPQLPAASWINRPSQKEAAAQ